MRRFWHEITLAMATKGFARVLLILLAVAGDYVYDWRSGYKTCSWVPVSELGISLDKQKSAAQYVPTTVASLRSLFRVLQLEPEGAFLDLGSGKGRVLLVAAEHGFREVRGVEFSSLLVGIAEHNLAAYRARHTGQTRFELVEADVRDYTLRDDETVVYLFDPFSAEVLEGVTQKIRDSLGRRQRRMHIVYRSPAYAEVFERDPAFRLVRRHHAWGHEFSVYQAG